SRPSTFSGAVRGAVHSPFVRIAGVVLCVAGVAFAIWARRTLGKNWGMPMTVHQSPELVTSGPYATVRHPIYSAILLALSGTALALNLWWFVAVAAALAYFSFAARREERTMLAAFPREYPAYRERTKMIVPWIF